MRWWVVVLLKTLVVIIAVITDVWFEDPFTGLVLHYTSCVWFPKLVTIVVVAARCFVVVHISSDDSLVCCCWLCFVTEFFG